MFEDEDDVVAALTAMHRQTATDRSVHLQPLEDEAALRAEIEGHEWRHLFTQQVIDAAIENGTARQLLLSPEPTVVEDATLDLDSLEKIEDLDVLAARLLLYGIYGECERSNALIRSVADVGVWRQLLQDRLDRKRLAPLEPVKRRPRPKQHKELHRKGQWPSLPSLLDFAAETERDACRGEGTAEELLVAV